MKLDQLQRGQFQPRSKFNESKLDELTQSIASHGVIQPLVVRQISLNQFEIIAGERRWRAAKQAGLNEVPVVVRDIDDQVALAIALIENIQREDLNALEESEAYAVLNSKFEMSHDAIAKAVGKKRVTVSNSLRLLKLPPDIRKSLRMGEISAGHARAILQAKTGPAMNRIWISILRRELSVRAAEYLVKSTIEPPKRKKVILTKKAPQVQALENQLIEILGTKVLLKAGKKGGTIEISYFSNNDLERILDLINSIS